VGLGGKNLSRTQRQKIGIARALLSSAQLLIFDKTTASIDPEAQRSIHAYIFNKKFNKGVIWLLHEAESAKDFDQILVFKEGIICEQGTYNNLIKNDGEFKTLTTLHSSSLGGVDGADSDVRHV
jgi:ABC-type multidrug transport system fused ATPase/permease subunit